MKRRRLEFDSLEQVLAEAEALAAGGYSRCGNWGLGQICDHLAVAFHGCIDGVDYVAPWYFRSVLRPAARVWLLTTGRMPAGVRVTGRLIPGTEREGETAGALERLRRAVERFSSHDGPFVTHPYLGRLSREQWVRFHLIHCAHHLGFLRPAGAASVDRADSAAG